MDLQTAKRIYQGFYKVDPDKLREYRNAIAELGAAIREYDRDSSQTNLGDVIYRAQGVLPHLKPEELQKIGSL